MVQVKKTTLCANDISPRMALLYVCATNILCKAFADIPDFETRIKLAKKAVLDEQPALKLSMKRLADSAEECCVDNIKQVNKSKPKYH